jgi:hypothetical protein
LIDDPKRELRTFRVALGASMGSKRGQGRGSFLGSVLDLLDTFYESTVQTIKPWAAAPPKLRPEQPEPGQVEDVPGQLISTALSSQDGAEDDAVRESGAPVDEEHPAPTPQTTSGGASDGESPSVIESPAPWT